MKKISYSEIFWLNEVIILKVFMCVIVHVWKGGRGSVHMSAVPSCRSSINCWKLQTGTAMAWVRGHTVLFNQRRWEWMGEDRRGEDGTRWGGWVTQPPAQKTEGQQFVTAEGRNTRTQQWNRLTTLLPVLIHPQPPNHMATKSPGGTVFNLAISVLVYSSAYQPMICQHFKEYRARLTRLQREDYCPLIQRLRYKIVAYCWNEFQCVFLWLSKGGTMYSSS